MMVRPGDMRRGVELERAATALCWNIRGLGVAAGANIERGRHSWSLSVEAKAHVLVKYTAWKAHVDEVRGHRARILHLW